MASSSRENTRICNQFSRTGTCNFPNCRYTHTSTGPPPPKAPCNYFLARGHCGFGDACKFSHDTSVTRPPEDPTSAISLYKGWSQLLGSRTSARTARGLLSDLNVDQMERFLVDAHKILEIGTSESVQQLIGDLGSERGLKRILQLVESNFALGYSLSGLGFKRHCLVFLKVVAHEEMRSSLVLEKEVGTIFNFIYGPGGRRGVGFFTRVVDQLERLAETDTREELEGALLPTATALFNTLNLNDAAVVQDQFKKIANTLITLSTRHGDSGGPFNYTYRCVQEELNRIKVLLQMADTIPSASSRMRVASQAPLQSFARHSVDLPGELSREGPRHDNDHADISKIKILPSSQEISSHRNEFLPQRALEYPHHLEGIARVLDFQFRLLREDTAGQIREAVRAVQDGWAELVEEGGKGKQKGRNSGVRTLLYRNAVIERIKCSQRDGLVLNTTFDQPSKVQALTDKARKEWWAKSKYLQVGSLLCLVDNFKRSTFLVVCERTANIADNKKNRSVAYHGEVEEGIQDLGSNKQRAMITLRFAGSVSEVDIENVFKDVDSREETTQVLVEFPGLLFTSFDPVLKCLQQASKTGNVPFPKWLAPSPVYEYASEPGSKEVDVPPPLYMTKPGMSLDLKSITGKGQPLSYSVGQEFNIVHLRQRTTLDHGQCEALIASLSRELALIQGPPGTGKSYLGIEIVKVLLDNREKTNIGPIICVCYTNHALDQFLENLLADGITSIVRIGSRSKSEAVAALSLHNVSQRADRTRLERYQVAKARESILAIESSIEEACGQLLNPKDPKVLKEFLEEHYPTAFTELFSNEPDEHGWVRVRGGRGGRSGTGEILGDWIAGRGMDPNRIPRTNRPVEALLTTSVLAMSRIEKMKLLDYWYDSMKELASSKLLKGSEDHTVERLNLTRQYQEQERRCLQESHIIGVTTTGFATHSDLIRSVNAKVLICEEAAEVLEAHILSALLPTVEHAILIGDHLQLRPQIMNHDFSMENPRGGKAYGLDTSLFERTAEVETYGGKKFPVASLDTQRRMDPSIASLVRNTLYPYLVDHPDTMTHPAVKGMARRMFWMDHRVLEDGADKLELIQTSHANEFEADMVVELVRHLSRQGVYKSGEIAVLSPYLRQLFVLRRKLASMFEVVVGDRDQEQLDEEMSGDEEMQPITVPVLVPSQQVKKGSLLNEVRVATVDNFQGEEAKIIIISLVRSNKEKKCGFLKTSNRINVLLSRAQDGMYIIGNAETCAPIDMWSKVITMFEKGQNIDRRLELCCPRHRETPIFVAEPDDFHLFSPEGGCSERCEWRLTCGHPCLKKCHSEVLHQGTMCLEPCNRTFPHCAHICPKPCGVACGKCDERVRGVLLACGHAPSSLRCHQLQELSEIRCRQMVQRKLSACGHEVMMECNKDPDAHRCSKLCGGVLQCGHPCQSRCTECTRVRNQGEEGATVISVHGPCKKTCGRKYTNCPHACISKCHGGEACPPCKQQCEIRCEHSRCGRTCTEPCAPCAERCAWTCVHRERCEMPCAVPCDINPCSKRCERQLDCGHQCPSVCGERCPPAEFCRECGTKEVLGRVVDLIMFEPYSEINVDTDPIIVPTCGHFYTMETYDNIMGMKNAYEMDELGTIVGPKALDGSGGTTGREGNNEEPPDRLVVKNCPDCRSPLRDIHRYNRIVKVACLDESTRRFCTNSQANFLQIYQEVSDAQDLFQANRDEFIRRLHAAPKVRGSEGKIPQTVQERTRRTLMLGTKIQRFVGTVSEEEQPYSKVRQMAISAQRRRNAQGNFVVDSSAVQMGFRLKSLNLLLSFRWESLWDTHLIAASFSANDSSVVLLRNQMLRELRNLHGLCSDVIEECQMGRLSKYEVEARLRRAQFFGLYRLESNAQSQQQQGSNTQPNPPNGNNFDENGQQEEERSLDICDTLCRRLPGTVGPLKPQIDEARRLLRGIAFYTTVTAEEKRLVHEAMAAEFSTTGRWYTCANGHPFTIGNCGAPRQLTMCPECGSPIGGDHRGLAGGVNHAAEFVALDQQMRRTGI